MLGYEHLGLRNSLYFFLMEVFSLSKNSFLFKDLLLDFFHFFHMFHVFPSWYGKTYHFLLSEVLQQEKL